VHAINDRVLHNLKVDGQEVIARVLRNWPLWAPLRAAFAKQVQEVRLERNAKVAAKVDLWLTKNGLGNWMSAKKEKTAGWFQGSRKRARGE